MPEGFKVGSAYIEVDADADPAISKILRQLKSSKGRLSQVGDEMGQELGRKLGAGVEKQLRATKGRLSVLATDIGNTVGARISSTMDKQLRGAKGRLSNTADGLGQTIGARVSASMAKSLKLGDGIGGNAKALGTRVGMELGEGIDDGASSTITRSPKIKKALDSVAERTNAQFKAILFTSAFAGLPVAAGAAAAATIGALAAVPIALVAGAALIQQGNEDVAKSYTRLSDTAVTVMTRASSVLVDDLVAGTDRLAGGMRRLEPAMTGAFRLAAPAVDGVVTSVLVLTDEALPGVITGLTKTQDAMRGVENLSRGIGRGVSDFFTNVSAGSKSAATNAEVLGRMMQDLGGFVGTTLANLSNGGQTVLPMFANALSMIYGIVTTLTGSGVAPLVAGVTGFITVVSGALGVVSALTGLLGGWLAPLAASYGAFKALDMITFGRLSGQFTGLGDRIRGADGARGKFQAGMSGMASMALSPAGLAVGALTIGLGLLGVAHQKAAADAAAQRGRISDLSAALRESKGAIDDNVRAQAAKSLADTEVTNTGKNYLQLARELGISQADLTSAYLGNASASERVKTALKGMVDGSIEWRDTGTGATEMMSAQGIMARDLMEALGGVDGEFAKASQANRDLMNAMSGAAGAAGTMTPALAASQQAAKSLGAAFTTLYNPIASVSDKANALIAILDRLAGRTPSYEEAIQSNNDVLRSMADAMQAGIDKTKGWGAELINANGTINTFTENGSNLQNNLVTLQSGFANAGASIQALVEGGMDYHVAAGVVTADLERQRAGFIATNAEMLGGAEAAALVADKYGLIPSEVVTKVTDAGSLVATGSDIDRVRGKLAGLPPNTPVRVTSITAEAEAKLEALGYTVTHMPDGTVLIHTNAPAVQSQVEGVADRMNRLQSKTVSINVVTHYSSTGTPATIGGKSVMSATGGYQTSSSSRGGPRTRATGGPLPYLAGVAGAAVTGERGPEISFPSRTSYIATAQQTQRMEQDVKAGHDAAQERASMRVERDGDGRLVTVNIYVTPPPSMDVDALTAKISRKLGRALKGGN